MAAGKFTKAAARLIQFLGEDRCAVAGGMAVNAHGYIRATRDVDVIVAMPLREAQKRLRGQGVEARLFKGDSLDGDFDCLKGVIAVGPRAVDAVPFDVLPELVPLTLGGTIELVVRDQRLRVVDADTLIALKLRAGGPNDLYDVAMLAALHPDWEDKALAMAAATDKELAERLVALMRSPRLRGQARDAQRQEKALRAFVRTRKER